ncbi:MAG TPA: ABC transporter ATP-binding protein [Candidatus Solibacter sp.]|nr:ABC transporter ATP-binding protein [Candidatus Solibacter sp.]
MNHAPVIETRDLAKSYGAVEAVRDLNLTVYPNRITGFLGRNGAGKSTTIKMLLGMIRPTAGTGAVLGRAIADPAQSVELRRRVAYVSEDKRLYDYMTVEQIIRFTAGFYPDWRAEAGQSLLRMFELPPKRKIKSLSKGMRTKLALLLAFTRRPELLILDEPSEGLDPVAIEQLLEALVTRSAEGTAVFFSSHQIAEVERVADDVCIIEKGRLLVHSPLDHLRQFFRRIDLVFPHATAEDPFRIPGVESIRTRGAAMSVFASSNSEIVVERARELSAVSIDVAPVGLREIFLETVKEN